jgi:hypothetical protein
MPDDRQSRDDNRGTPREQTQRTVRSSRRTWLLLAVVPGFCLLCCCGAVVAYLIFGIESTSDPVQIRAALDGMTDVQLPPGLGPST